MMLEFLGSSVFARYDRDDCGKGITDWTNADFSKLTEIVLDFQDLRMNAIYSVWFNREG
jgi:hypothetical protein